MDRGSILLLPDDTPTVEQASHGGKWGPRGIFGLHEGGGKGRNIACCVMLRFPRTASSVSFEIIGPRTRKETWPQEIGAAKLDTVSRP